MGFIATFMVGLLLIVVYILGTAVVYGIMRLCGWKPAVRDDVPKN